MKNSIVLKRVFSFTMLFVIVFGMFLTCQAVDSTTTTPITLPTITPVAPTESTASGWTKITTLGSTVLYIFYWAAVLIATIALILLGIKYFLADAKVKADIKNQLVVVAVAAFLVWGGPFLIKLLGEFFTSLK